MTERIEHTPGPWAYEISANAPEYFDVFGDGPIAQVERWTAEGDDSDVAHEAEQNARLIAAAPELLDALDNLTQWLLLEPVGWEEQEPVAAALEAISKVRGSS